MRYNIYKEGTKTGDMVQTTKTKTKSRTPPPGEPEGSKPLEAFDAGASRGKKQIKSEIYDGNLYAGMGMSAQGFQRGGQIIEEGMLKSALG